MTLMECLMENGTIEEIIEVFELITELEDAYAALDDYQKNPSYYNEEEISYLRTDIEDWQEQLANYETKYKQKL